MQLLSLDLVLRLSPSASAQEAHTSPSETAAIPAYRFRLLGIYDQQSGEPLSDVEVTDLLSGNHAQTSKTGTVSLFFVPHGGGLVRVRKFGYAPQTMFVRITAADTTPVTVAMGSIRYLETVIVHDTVNPYRSPSLRGAYERMHTRAGGYFIDELAMREGEGSTLANVLIAHAAGLSAVPGPKGTTRLVSQRGKPNCPVTLFIDGIPSTGQADYGRMSSNDYAMAEYYPGGATAPVEFGGTKAGNCGVLLLWTRER